jgi:hypothetical protein
MKTTTCTPTGTFDDIKINMIKRITPSRVATIFLSKSGMRESLITFSKNCFKLKIKDFMIVLKSITDF